MRANEYYNIDSTEQTKIDLTELNREIEKRITNIPSNYLALELSLLKANMLFASTLESPSPSDSYDTNIEDDDTHFQDDTNPRGTGSSSDNYITKDTQTIHDEVGGKPHPSQINKVHKPRRV